MRRKKWPKNWILDQKGSWMWRFGKFIELCICRVSYWTSIVSPRWCHVYLISWALQPRVSVYAFEEALTVSRLSGLALVSGWEHPRVCFDMHPIARGTKCRGAWQLSILGGYDVSLAQAIGVHDITTARSSMVRAAEEGVLRGCVPVWRWPWLVSAACTTVLEPAVSPCSHTSACLAPGTVHVHTPAPVGVSMCGPAPAPAPCRQLKPNMCPGPLPLNPEVPLRTPWPLQPLLPEFLYPSITSVTNNKWDSPSSEFLSLIFFWSSLI